MKFKKTPTFIGKNSLLFLTFLCGTQLSWAEENNKSFDDTQQYYANFVEKLRTNPVRAYLDFSSKFTVSTHHTRPAALLKGKGANLQKNVKVKSEIINSLFAKYPLKQINSGILDSYDKRVFLCLGYPKHSVNFVCYGFDVGIGIVTFINSNSWEVKYMGIDFEMVAKLQPYFENEVFHQEIDKIEKRREQYFLGGKND